MKKYYVNKYDEEFKTWCDERQTSREIGQAIWEYRGSEKGQYRVWFDPTDREIECIEKRAWELADPDNDELYWGNYLKITRIGRPV